MRWLKGMLNKARIKFLLAWEWARGKFRGDQD